MTQRTCVECGVSIEGTARKKFCSDLCSWRMKEKRKRDRGYYRRPDVMARQRRIKKAQYDKEVEEGVRSGRLLKLRAKYADSFDGTCVIDRCEKTAYAAYKCRRHYEMESGRSAFSRHYKLRAEEAGVEYVAFDRLSIFDRDGWICGICDDPVDRAMEYPDPMSVSLDHIIPLSKGGSHTPENVQCAHLDCNLRKGVDHGERRELERST